MESILNSIKKLLGIPVEQDNFDIDIIMHINSVFSTLWELGVGPEERFRITDELATWDDFMPDDTIYDELKSYMYLKVRLIFDPPTSSAYMSTMKELIAEYEWRLTVKAENYAEIQNGE
jgi:hypothetical protein